MFWLQPSVVYTKQFTPRSWRRPTRAHSLLEVQTMETSIEFFPYLVAMARILVVFVRIHRKSRRKRQAKAFYSSGQPVVYRTLAKTSDEWLSRIHFILLQLCKDNTWKDPFSRCEICKNWDTDWVDDDWTKSDCNIQKKRTLYLELRMRGEKKLTYKTFLLNGETSDTNHNVKTKINTKNMKPDNDVTHLVNTWMCV